MQNSNATLLLVDDFPAWRSCVREMLEPYLEWEIIAEAWDGEQAVQKATDLQPDIILLDLGLPKLNGIEAARRIRQYSPKSRIVFLTADGNKDIMQAALTIVGTRYVRKANAAADLVDAIAAALVES